MACVVDVERGHSLGNVRFTAMSYWKLMPGFMESENVGVCERPSGHRHDVFFRQQTIVRLVA